jgi:hypothetical protein
MLNKQSLFQFNRMGNNTPTQQSVITFTRDIYNNTTSATQSYGGKPYLMNRKLSY